jgi:5-methylcytosine-specific restriction protein A
VRREFPKQVKVQAAARANGRCDGCGARLVFGGYHYDHDIPDALGGDPTLENCRVLCKTCHGAKTTQLDVPRIAKGKRQRDMAQSITTPKGRLQSRGFDKAEPQRTATRPILSRTLHTTEAETE